VTNAGSAFTFRRGGGFSACDDLRVNDPDDVTLLGLLRRCREDHRAWINGDGSSYALGGDGTIMGAIGGHGRGGPETLRRQVATAARWTSGEGTVEFVNGGVASDIAWLAMIERASVTIAGQPGPRRRDFTVSRMLPRADT
jgi:hypothetical protein